MNTYIRTSIFVCALLLASGTLYAETTANGSQVPPVRPLKQEIREKAIDMRQEIRDDRKTMNTEIKDERKKLGTSSPEAMKELREKAKDTRQDFREETKEKRVDMERFRVEQSLKIVKMRLSATVERLTNILSKIDTRIAEVKAKGGDVTNAEKASLEAKTAISTAKQAVDAITLSLPTETASSTTAIEIKATLKKDVRNAEGLIKNAHVAVTNVLKTLKPKLDRPATTTVTN